MTCAGFAGQLSPWSDGELDAVAARSLETHLATCGACGAELERLHQLNRRVRLRPADAVPDLTARILDAASGSAWPGAGRRVAHDR